MGHLLDNGMVQHGLQLFKHRPQLNTLLLQVVVAVVLTLVLVAARVDI
jgi:hypothetical protein